MEDGAEGLNPFLDRNQWFFPPDSSFRQRSGVLYEYSRRVGVLLTGTKTYLWLLADLKDQLPEECYSEREQGQNPVDFVDKLLETSQALEEARWRITLDLDTAQIYQKIDPKKRVPKTVHPTDIVKLAADKINECLTVNRRTLRRHFRAHPIKAHFTPEGADAISEYRKALILNIADAITTTQKFKTDFTSIPVPSDVRSQAELAQLNQFIEHEAFLRAFRKVADQLPDDSPPRKRYELIYNLTHEFLGPLTFIRGFTELLGGDDVNAKNLLEGVRAAIDQVRGRLAFIVENKVRLTVGGLDEVLREIEPAGEPIPEGVTPESLIRPIVEDALNTLNQHQLVVDGYFQAHPITDNNQQKFLAQVKEGFARAIGTVKYIWGSYTGEFLAQPQPVDFCRTIETEAEAVAFTNSTKLAVQIENQSSLESITVDPSLLTLILRNLFQNLYRYGESSGVMTIEQVNQSGRRSLRFSLKDQGIGIKQEDLGRIFKRGFRTEAAAARRKEGMGVGLDICVGIVKSWNGEIWAESKGLGMGSTFTFTIPLEDH